MNCFHFSHWVLTLVAAAAFPGGFAVSTVSQLRASSPSLHDGRTVSEPHPADEWLNETSQKEYFSLFQKELRLTKERVEREGARASLTTVLLCVIIPVLAIVLAYLFIEAYRSDIKSTSATRTTTPQTPWPATIPAGQRLLQPEIAHNASPPPSAVAAAAAGVPFIGRAAGHEGSGPVHFPKIGSSSSALVVQSMDGVVLQADRTLAPKAEQCNVNFRSLKGANAVIRAKVAEHTGDSKVRVESASGVALALLDTTAALDKQSVTRRVVIHRVIGSTWDVLGPPCAAVVRTSARSFSVRNIVDGVAEPDGLFVQCYADGRLQSMQDTNGTIIARHEPVGHRGGDPRLTVWVTQGADLAMVVSIWLSVQKLA